MPHDGYAHNLQASSVEGSSRRYRSSPDCTSRQRQPFKVSQVAGGGDRSQHARILSGPGDCYTAAGHELYSNASNTG